MIAAASSRVAPTPSRAPGDAATVTLDVTRLLSRALHPTPTGIDRVELAYARWRLAADPTTTRFVARAPGFGHRALSRAAVARLVANTEALWRGERAGRGRLAIALRALATGGGPASMAGPRPILLLSAHQRLTDPARLRARLARTDTRLVAFIHDAIPVEYPEYARPAGVARHRTRLETAVTLADGLIVNSAATRASLAPWLKAAGRAVPVLVAPLGIDLAAASPVNAPAPLRPYFLCVGTIEPRKNHLLLLHVWRRLVERLGADATPRLVIVGRRGWECENAVDMLERCPALKDVVDERGRVDDHELEGLYAGARALLMPSFVEGYGLPVAEALARRLPVIASDIPAHREVGGAVPDWLDPLDGPGWAAAAIDYAPAGSARRQAQVERLAGWRAPTWDAHFDAVGRFLAGLGA